MKQIHNWNDLQPYGVEFVGHNPRGYQFLCDLTPEGKLLVEAVFGCPLAIPQGANGRYRILMPPNMWESLAVVALWRTGAQAVYVKQDFAGVMAVDPTDPAEAELALIEWYQGTACCLRNSGQGKKIAFRYVNPGTSVAITGSMIHPPTCPGCGQPMQYYGVRERGSVSIWDCIAPNCPDGTTRQS